MPKRKRRPWLDDAVVDRTKARDGEKTAARKARERAFREKHPERFEEDREAGTAGTTDASTSERRDGDEGRGRADEGERRRRRRGGDGTTTSGRGERDGSLETVETDLSSWLAEAEPDRLAAAEDAVPDLPHHLQHAITAAYHARSHARPDTSDLARKALGAIAEYRAFRGWKG